MLLRIIFVVLFIVLFLEDDLAHDPLVEEINDEATNRQPKMMSFKDSHDFVEERRFLEAGCFLRFDAAET